jgi:hypothetical protein
MTYSIKTQAHTRDELKKRITQQLQTQCAGQPGHQHDRPHVERVLHAWVDSMKEHPHCDIHVDAYGYVSIAGDGTPTLICGNIKVSLEPKRSDPDPNEQAFNSGGRD